MNGHHPEKKPEVFERFRALERSSARADRAARNRRGGRYPTVPMAMNCQFIYDKPGCVPGERRNFEISSARALERSSRSSRSNGSKSGPRPELALRMGIGIESEMSGKHPEVRPERSGTFRALERSGARALEQLEAVECRNASNN